MKNKKTLLIIAGIISILVLLIISSNIDIDKKNEKELKEEADVILTQAEKESKKIKESEKKDFIYIDTNKFLEDYQSEDKNIVLIASSTCNYCKIAEPLIQNIAYKYNLDVEYLSTDNLTKEEKTSILNADEFFSDGVGTPLLLILGNNSIIDKVDGLTDQAHYVDFFKKNNI